MRQIVRTGQIVELLRILIEGGEYHSGDRLPPERELALQVGATRTTLREALGQLQSDGYLVPKQGRGGGWYVSDLSAPVSRRLAQMKSGTAAFRAALDFRIAVESSAAELAAERRTEADLAVIQAAYETRNEIFENWLRDSEAQDDGETLGSPQLALARTDADFHRAVTRAAQNRHLEDAVLKARAGLFALMRDTPGRDLIRASVDDHGAILRAIAAGNAEEARRAMRRHLERSRALEPPQD